MNAETEQVERPNGKVWRLHPQTGRAVRVRRTPTGTEVVVCGTHELDRAARMASVRWGAFHPGAEQPEGSREWGRMTFGRRRSGQAPVVFDTRPEVEHSEGVEPRSFPIVVFRLPDATEGAA